MEVVILGAATGAVGAIGLGAAGWGIGTAPAVTVLDGAGGGVAGAAVGAALGILGAGAAGAAGGAFGTLAGAAGGAAAGLVAVGAPAGFVAAGAAAGAAPPPAITTFRSLAPKTPATSSGTTVCFWSVRLASPFGPMAARMSDSGKSIIVPSCEVSCENVPAGAPLRNWPKGIRTAPLRNCCTATAVGIANVPAGRSNTIVAKLSGSQERISFNGMAIVSPTGAVARVPGMAAAGVAGAAGFAALGVAAGAGVWAGTGTDSSVTGTLGGGLVVLENNFLKTPNINRAVVYCARTH
jgi:hypothetical protein